MDFEDPDNHSPACVFLHLTCCYGILPRPCVRNGTDAMSPWDAIFIWFALPNMRQTDWKPITSIIWVREGPMTPALTPKLRENSLVKQESLKKRTALMCPVKHGMLIGRERRWQ